MPKLRAKTVLKMHTDTVASDTEFPKGAPAIKVANHILMRQCGEQGVAAVRAEINAYLDELELLEEAPSASA